MEGYYVFRYFNKIGIFNVKIFFLNFNSFLFVLVEKRFENVWEGKYEGDSISFVSDDRERVFFFEWSY